MLKFLRTDHFMSAIQSWTTFGEETTFLKLVSGKKIVLIYLNSFLGEKPLQFSETWLEVTTTL